MKHLSFLLFLLAMIAVQPTPLYAQTTAEEWIESAEKAEAEGRWSDAGTARSNAAKLQAEKGEYEKAGDNYKQAAENFRKDGREGQADVEDIHSGENYDSAAAEAEAAGKSQKAKELYKKSAEQYDKAQKAAMAEAARKKAEQVIEILVHATGTGNTTGHIADLTVNNKGNTPINILEQTVFIPSDGQYQPYITVVPPTTVPPGITTIPLDGYCVDVHTPPVPANNPMPPVTTWIPVVDPNEIIPVGTVSIIPTPPVPTFDPGDIPGIITSPNYKPVSPDPEAGIIVTWPGTDIPVGGTFVPGDDPGLFAPVIAKVFEEVSTATKSIQNQETHPTPFSPNPPKEYPAIVQNVIWMVTSILSGEEYTKDDFASNLYNQLTITSGKPVASLPEEQKEEIDEGIDQFWNVFTAVGVEAKVLKEGKDPNEPGVPGEGMDDPSVIPIATVGTKVLRVDSLTVAERYKHDLKNCFFSRLEYSVFIQHKYTRGSGSKKKHTVDEYFADDKNTAELKLQKDDTLTVSLKDLSCVCPCWTNKDAKSGVKSGPLCGCEITGVSQRSYNTQAFTDLTEADLDKLVMETLTKEIQAKIDALKKANGKKSEIDKLQKQLDDEKIMRKDNKDRIAELRKNLEAEWRLKINKSQSSFKVKAAFRGEVEFIFDVKGKCTAVDDCKGSEFSREIKVTIKVP